MSSPAAEAAIAPFPLTPVVTQTSAVSPVAADMNGDGLPDLVSLQGPSTSPSVAVLLNTGSGYALSPSGLATLNCAASAPIAVDVNGDGKQDVVLACPASLVVLLGKGDGTLQAPVSVTEPALSALVAVDLNGDSYPDILGVNAAGGISILLNKGTAAPGTFATATTLSGSGNLLVAGDFNGDGKQDLLLGSTSSAPTSQTSLEVYFGNGDGTLQSPVASGSGYLYGFTAGDWNGDGVTDIAYTTATDASGSSPTLVSEMGATSGSFSAGSSYALPAGGAFSQLLALKHPLATGYTSELVLTGAFTTLFFGSSSGQLTQGPDYALSGTPIEQLNSDNSTQVQFFLSGYYVSASVADSALDALAAIPIDHSAAMALGDINGDGLPDVVSISSGGKLTITLSRGNGSFSTLSQISTSANGLLTGDFNGDGREDVLAYEKGIAAGLSNDTLLPQLLFYAGDGSGALSSVPLTETLTLSEISAIASADFNGDSIADLIVVALGTSSTSQSSGIFFLAGKGNGSFAAPVQLEQLPALTSPTVLTADLNHDGKMDFVYGADSYLGNGDGTFSIVPMGIAAEAIAVALGDVNGDNKPDMVTSQGDILAGNGDGTFQSSSLYTISIPSGASLFAAAIGDVDGDGEADVVAQLAIPGSISWLVVLDGDGQGDFTAEMPMYYAGSIPATSTITAAQGLLTRLNNAASALASDTTLDYLSVPDNFIVAPLFNALNPAAVAPTVLPSLTTLAVSATSISPGTQITLTATVSGYEPSGEVSFATGSTSLGEAQLVNGVASLSATLNSAGNYVIVATYAGDSNNTGSTSNGVTVEVATPGFTLAASPAAATVTAGKSATTTLTVTPSGGYAGTVSLSCGSLPAGVSCSFSPASISMANGTASSTLTISTTASTTAALANPRGDPGRAVWAGLFCLILLPFGKTSRRWKMARASFLAVFLMAMLFTLSACGTKSTSSGSSTTTGSGTLTITVEATDSSANLSQTLSLPLTVQ